mgnify:CR=1 FL=1
MFLFAAVAGAIVSLWRRHRYLQEKAEEEEKERLLEGVLDNTKENLDEFYLRKAHEFRLSLDPPQQSHFRVTCILLLENANMVFGTNDEPSPSIANSICAERCALLRYRTMLKTSPVKTIYIVTDADKPVPPGMLCREYMYGHPATRPTTRVVMQSNDLESEPFVLTLEELHPYPSIYTGMPPEEQTKFGTKHQVKVQAEVDKLEIIELTEKHVLQLIKAARSACQLDTRDTVHAMRYGAAAALQSHDAHIQFISAPQVKGLEYGCTQDAVCQLASDLLAPANNSLKVVAVVQVDQFGIPHGLFAHARSFMIEHGFGDCRVILTVRRKPGDEHYEEGVLEVQSVLAKDLTPHLLPELRLQARNDNAAPIVGTDVS